MPLNQKIGRGSLGKTKRQREGGPGYIGSLTFEHDVNAGEKVWLASWVKTDDDGNRYFSIVVERPPPDQQRDLSRKPVAPPPRAPGAPEMDDEIPF